MSGLMAALLARMDAERAHEWALNGLNALQSYPRTLRILSGAGALGQWTHLKVRIGDLEFANPVGLAAGWDKNAVAPGALASLGFGFLEMGTVTLWPEAGNARPRIFRGRRGQWMINRVGFANDGAWVVRERLQRLQNSGSCVVGVSLGKMRTSGSDQLLSEVMKLLEMLYLDAAFFSVNVSSPNTPKGFLMGRPDFLAATLKELVQENRSLAHRLGRLPKPIFVKVAPTVNWDHIRDMAASLRTSEINGVIVSNTLATPEGGLSGLPLRAVSKSMTARLYLELDGKIPIIGVGGILTPQDAWERILAGASMIQIFSGFVFKGAGLIGKICSHIERKLALLGLDRLEQACGMKAKDYALE
ncbi:MAG: quinone-dependent dihydroorotate dehydrogenase [Elusimicrobia bacterium]|nr:quinone-dependent dihydroorotate dehydrogenase [Elusimicrobiota bacterium]